MRILFVCHGNVFGSAVASRMMADHLRSAQLPEDLVRSAGTAAQDGAAPPAAAIEAAAAMGINLRSHRASRLRIEDISACDLILVMDGANEAVLLDRFPHARSKVLLLGTFDPTPEKFDRSLPDPLGVDRVAIDRSFAAIRRSVAALAGRLRLAAQLPGGRPLTFVRRTLFSEAALPLWEPFARRAACILMMHRFNDPVSGVRGLSPSVLAEHLELLRRRKYHLCSLRQLIAQLEEGVPIAPRTIVFTIDDGYRDSLAVGAEVFARYDCPVTIFLVSGFVDGACWMWEDVIRYLVRRPEARGLRLSIDGVPTPVHWSSDSERELAEVVIIAALKRLTTTRRDELIAEWFNSLGLVLPSAPPVEFAPVTWELARRWSSRGVDFGAHTETHPILAKSDDSRASYEIGRSWERVRGEIPGAVPVFCYPNGMRDDFGDRERAYVQASGQTAALQASGGVCSRRHFAKDRFALPRLAYEEHPSRFRRVVGGAEHALHWSADIARRVLPVVAE